MTRILWSSNSPWSPTGYGKQTKYIIRAIRDLGYPIACLCWWGLEGGSIEWEGIPCFPKQLDAYGNDATQTVIQKFKADILFTLIDLWVMDVNLGKYGAKWIPLLPIDHDEVPPPVAQRFPHAYKLISYSKSGVEAIKRAGYEADYIPHGVDCEIMRPCSREERNQFRRKYYPDWPIDAWIVGMVAANKGWPSRKSFLEAMAAFAQFASEYPETRMYLHSTPTSEFGGPNLQEMAQHYGVADKVRYVNPKFMIGGQISEEELREIFCTFDVFLNPAQGEGFGIPIVEAQACGIPVIVNDFSAMTEVTGAGWRVPPLRLQPTLVWAKQALADVDRITHALKEARRILPNHHMSEIAREFALQYDWPTVIEKYWKPYLEQLDAGRKELAGELG